MALFFRIFVSVLYSFCCWVALVYIAVHIPQEKYFGGGGLTFLGTSMIAIWVFLLCPRAKPRSSTTRIS